MARVQTQDLKPSGFFVLRTPLLPFDELESWCAEVQGSSSTEDRALLADRLLTTWQRPEVREAIFLASPELHAALDREAKPTDRVMRSLVAYFTRMTARSTPFGLFAGCSPGEIAARTGLELPAQATYRRHTRLDMDYLSALVAALESDPETRGSLHFLPNTSLYPAGGRLHYAESRLDSSRVRTYHLVAVEESPELSATLERASERASLDQLESALSSSADVSPTEAADYIDELVKSQLLVSDLGPDVTGDEAIHGLIERLHGHPVALSLAGIQSELTDMDTAGVGGSTPERYQQLHTQLEQLPARAAPARLFQVDMIKPAPALSLGPTLLAELTRGVALLNQLTSDDTDSSSISQFIERFIARYEAAEVPLVEVLDEEIGIGFGAASDPGGEPLLEGIGPFAMDPPDITWQPRDAVLLGLLSDALRSGAQEIELGEPAIASLTRSNPPRLPEAVEVFARVAATSSEAIDRGQFSVLLQSVGGPPGARLLGRFCHADADLRRCVEDHLRLEEAHQPDAVFAEIVHLPEGRVGNILSRPVLRDYEIVFLGSSGAPPDRQIHIVDLRVAVREGRVVLRSARLNREVVPRLTTAHNFTYRSLGMYRFLCALQEQDSPAGLGWSWGPLESAPFLPRVSSGRLVLSRARWNIARTELEALQQSFAARQLDAVQTWLSERGIPRYVVLADGDNELVVDFFNLLSVETFLQQVKERPGFRLVELFPPADELCVSGPEGRFVHELIVPFVRTPDPVRRSDQTTGTTARTTAIQRRFAPGSEWLYARLYCGHATADRILVEQIRPLVDEVTASGAADAWFFIRYTDPDHHLRLRFHGDPARLSAEVLPAMSARLEPLLADGRIARWQLDTYVREVERYGGSAGILLAERLFAADSEAVLSILPSTAGDAGLVWRWKLGACGVDLLLDALGFDLRARCEWIRSRRDAFGAEFGVDHRVRQQLGDKYRAERQSLAELLELAHSSSAVEYPPLQALQHRSEALVGIRGEIDASARAGELSVSIADLAASYAHMHLNRLLRSAQRAQEMVVYDLLDRIYRSQLAQRGAG
ncbi:MAG TPA: lantibiotic dehydratase [Chloroflexota bacterium]